MKTIRIQTREPYDVLIGEGILPTLGRRLSTIPGKGYRRVMLVCDDRVRGLYGGKVFAALSRQGLAVDVFDYPRGESAKTMSTVQKLMQRMCAHGLGREDVVIGLGGGVAMDLAGFASAMYLGGVDYVQAPTTMHAAVDSTVGGVVQVNLPAGRNLARLHHQPVLVLCDTGTMQTLAAEVFTDGLAEAVKHGCVWDEGLFHLLERANPRRDAGEIIARSVELKSKMGEEGDCGQILSFGHTIGQGIEKLSQFRLSHGKSVSVGMCMVADACARNGLMDEAEAGRLRDTLSRFGLPTGCRYSVDDICRESAGTGKADAPVELILLERIGKAAVYPIGAEHLADFFTGRLRHSPLT